LKVGAIPSQNIETADDILREVDDIMNELGITHFLWHGTCLCFYRDGDYCETDPDIDIGVIATASERKQLYDTMQERGYEGKNRPLWNCRFWKNDIEVDVFYHVESRFNEVLQDFDVVRYKNRDFNIPKPIETYLIMQYGPNWQDKQDWILTKGGWAKKLIH